MTPKLFLVTLLLAYFSCSLSSAQTASDGNQAATVSEQKKADEIEYPNAEEEDKKFDQVVLYDADRPAKAPVQDQVEQEYYTYLERNPEQAAMKAEKVDLLYYYLNYDTWFQPYYPCCPRSQDYDCRSVYHRLSCFRSRGRWCCPFSPTVYIANCNCGACVKQCKPSKCFAIGKCNRRYSLRTFWAVCWNGWWGEFEYFRMYLPSSCYCNAVC